MEDSTSSSGRTDPRDAKPQRETERQWRPLTLGEMNAVKMTALGGPGAATLWNAALNALLAYAKASDCPLGRDVALWFGERRDAYSGALREAHYAPAADEPSPSLNPEAE